MSNDKTAKVNKRWDFFFDHDNFFGANNAMMIIVVTMKLKLDKLILESWDSYRFSSRFERGGTIRYSLYKETTESMNEKEDMKKIVKVTLTRLYVCQ